MLNIELCFFVGHFVASDGARQINIDRAKKCYSGYIPILEANVSRLGFIASSSFSSPGYEPFGAFNNFNADGVNGSWKTNTVPSWLQIQCPDPVKIWRVALKCRAIDAIEFTEGGMKVIANVQISEWNISASNDGTKFTTLLTSTTALFGGATALSFFIIPSATAYQYYRLNITEANYCETVVGLQVMQLYALTT